MKMNLSKKSNLGFTLIELLLVVAIIGVFASIVFVALNSSRTKGTDAKIVTQLIQMTNQSFLFSGTAAGAANAMIVGTGLTLPAPYKVSAGITGSTAGGTAAGGTLFNDTTIANHSLYTLASGLPSPTYIYYGWNGVDPNSTGAWFFAASTSTGAFCNDNKNTKKIYTGTAISTDPTNVTSWTGGTTPPFPNATVAGGYSCN